MTLDEFNNLSSADAIMQLYSCCHCKKWSESVTQLRPFSTMDNLFATAQKVWLHADEAQILEAFSGHARIGDIELLRSRYAGRATDEQGQVLAATEETLQELQRLNIEYENRNGFIFIVCATGKSADEMLALLKSRINNDRSTELTNGAIEQGKITQLRLQKLFHTTKK